jgi:hypothetical protein
MRELTTRELRIVVSALEWLTPYLGVFGGYLLARGWSWTGGALIAAAVVYHRMQTSTKNTLLDFHEDEYRRLTGREP